MKIVKIMGRLNKALEVANAFLEKESGELMTLNELDNLIAVYSHGGSGLSYTARQLGISNAAMTGAMDSLVKKGLANRSADADRRRIKASVTQRGMDVLRRASEVL